MPATTPAPMDENELRCWIRLNLEPRLSARRIRQLLGAFGMPQEICAASSGSLARYLDPQLAARLSQTAEPEIATAIDMTVHWLQQPRHHLLTLADENYPAALLELKDAPPVLYAHGDTGLLQRPMIAIVGARSATAAGRQNATAFAQHLALKGWCVVSGLASGIDAAAHEGALQAGSYGAGTIAVLGTGIDMVYPAMHRQLSHDIAANGLLLSEFPLGTRALPHYFPQRNRIVAALARGTLIVEAAARSGSLITARLAGELGREVFAIPGSIHSPLSRGCHALIRQGAKLVESGEDILEELRQSNLPGTGAWLTSASNQKASGPKYPAAKEALSRSHTEPSLQSEKSSQTTAHLPDNAATTCPAVQTLPHSADEKASATTATSPDADKLASNAQVLLDALGYDACSLDTLKERTGWETGHLLQELTLLELSGSLVRQDDGRYIRICPPLHD